MRHLDNKQLIKPSQHAFLPGRSCQTNLLEFLERVTDDTDRGNNTDVAYLDFAKAFDKVPHARLLVKLKALGVNNQVSSWIEAWLRHRRQRVVVGGEESDWSAVSSGVPQGSILGPLLVIVYINDLDEKMTSTVLKFADDTKISSNSQQELQRDLDTAVEWAKTWQMQFNTNKCKVMHVGHRNERAIYNMGNHRLEEVEEEKDLGVLIHRTLSVSNNCAVAVKKANQMAGHIYRIVTHKSVQSVVPLYNALVRPHLEYCSLVWSPYLKKDILSIDKVQRRVSKMIPSISALTYEERLKRTGLISLENRRLRADLLEVFKILKGFVKVDPATHFSMSDRRSRGHMLKLEKPRARLELRRHFFSNRVIDAWNSLPGHMVEATSTNMFKAALQRLPHGAFKSWKQLPAPRGHLTT